MPSSNGLAWEQLEPAWQAAFELAWEAYAADTVPVGAVIVEAAGAIKARGRNRIFEPFVAGRLAGTLLAHAETSAYAQLPSPPRGEIFALGDCTLYTTLEPCALCMGASVMLGIGTVSFASRDRYGGSTTMRFDNDHSRRMWPRLEGPRPDGWARLSEIIHAEFWLRHDARIVAGYEGTPLLAAVRAWNARGAYAAAAAGTSLADFVAANPDLDTAL